MMLSWSPGALGFFKTKVFSTSKFFHSALYGRPLGRSSPASACHTNEGLVQEFSGSPTVDGRNPANQLRLVVYPIIYKGFNNIPGGKTRRISEPSTVEKHVIFLVVDYGIQGPKRG